jgi:hypothetical protein
MPRDAHSRRFADLMELFKTCDNITMEIVDQTKVSLDFISFRYPSVYILLTELIMTNIIIRYNKIVRR